MFTTNTDNFGGIKTPKNSVFLEYQTISDHYNFTSAAYTDQQTIQNRKADFRTLLYWNPDIEFKNEQKVEFYTSDHCSKYEVIIRGFTEDGKACFAKSEFEVK